MLIFCVVLTIYESPLEISEDHPWLSLSLVPSRARLLHVPRDFSLVHCFCSTCLAAYQLHAGARPSQLVGSKSPRLYVLVFFGLFFGLFLLFISSLLSFVARRHQIDWLTVFFICINSKVEKAAPSVQGLGQSCFCGEQDNLSSDISSGISSTV